MVSIVMPALMTFNPGNLAKYFKRSFSKSRFPSNPSHLSRHRFCTIHRSGEDFQNLPKHFKGRHPLWLKKTRSTCSIFTKYVPPLSEGASLPAKLTSHPSVHLFSPSQDLGIFAGDMYLEMLAAGDPQFSDAHPSGLNALLRQNEEMRRSLWSQPEHHWPNDVSFYISHKVSRLLKAIDRCQKKRQMVRCLVFVDRRAHAPALARFISALPLKQPIKAKPVTGGSGKVVSLTANQPGQAGNREVLKQFKEGGLDLLVATDVLAQGNEQDTVLDRSRTADTSVPGIDNPDCNLVIAFDVAKILGNLAWCALFCPEPLFTATH